VIYEGGKAVGVLVMGHRIEGDQAQYLLQSLREKAGKDSGRLVTFGEYIGSVFRLMTNAGILPREWMRWSRARMRAYINARNERESRAEKTLDAIASDAKAKKCDSLIRFTYPLRMD
jgi:hypothetical protein